jgi:hypothetical protein
MVSPRDVVTYEQLQAMTPEERSEHFRASIILDPATLPASELHHVTAIGARMDERTRSREDRVRGQAS